ncbi:MAG: UbiA family prenyltransferase [Eubacteriales bacterium]
MLKDILKLIRIKQWVKNAFVLAPLLFSLKFTDLTANINAILAFFSFCFISSVVYVINDICDRKRDAIHPKKKHRPIASGIISPFVAKIIAIILCCLTCLLLYLLDSTKTSIVILLYVLINILYSWKLKHIVLIDVLIIAVGFIFRLYAGSYAIDVPVSSFIFMTTLFLSLFLGFTKRKGELLRSGLDAREVLRIH